MLWSVAIEGGPRRVNHAAVTVGDKIFSFGGYCTGENYKEFRNIDVHILDTVILRWRVCESSKPSPDIPFQRYGHTVVAYGDKIFLWGGRNDTRACSKLFCFDTKTCTWTNPEVYGKIPDARDGHSACVIDNSMYIFAGYLESSDAYTQEIHALNLLSLTWKYVCAKGPKPIYRDFHTATSLNGFMYVWGGREVASGWYESLNQEEYGSQMHMFDPLTEEWSLVAASGEVPVGRRSHSAVTYRNKIYVFGGFNSIEKKHYNDLHQFDPEKCSWEKVEPLGCAPCPRRRQGFCLCGTKIFLFGGTSPSNTDPEFCFNEEEWDEEDEPQEEQALIDHGDLHVLDLEPTLKTLCILSVLKYKLETSCLPLDIQMSMKIMLMPNNISRPDNHTG